MNGTVPIETHKAIARLGEILRQLHGSAFRTCNPFRKEVEEGMELVRVLDERYGRPKPMRYPGHD